jgi:putative membrane protein
MMGTAPSTTVARLTDRAFVFIALISAAALAFLIYILAIRHGTAGAGDELAFLPAVNATLNALSATFLVLGYSFIRRRQIGLHKSCMIAALVSSVLFFTSYSVYHYVHGDTKYLGQGILRRIYFVILSSHIAISALIVPFVLITVLYAGTRRFARHKKIARITLPLWLYVSVTGVVVFFMLRNNAP